MNRSLISMSMVLVMTCCGAPAFAQATRTWVSGVGDDANPCSRTAPCKTFAGAISKTAAGGEIDALDPAGFGVVTVTKSITLDGGGGQVASILVAGTNGVTVNAGANDTVVVRNLSFNGLIGTVTPGLNGVRVLAAGQLIVDHVAFLGFSQNGIEMALAGGASAGLVVRNSTFLQGAAGVKLTSGMISASMENVSISGTGTGIDAVVGSADVKNSVLARNTSFGALAEGGSIDISDSLLTGNGTAVQSQAGSTVRIANSDIYNNLAGFGCGAGTLASAGNNRKGGNTGSGGPVCAPNATINLQ
jgi:hypothetical protein